MKKFFQDFKKFIAKGNVFDMAVGLIIATAFNAIVSSLVDDIIMPLFTWMLGAKSLQDLSVTLRWTEDSPSLVWNYGLFLQAILNFLVIAFSLFILVKFVSNSQRKLKEINSKYIEPKIKMTKAQIKEFKAKAKAENRKLRDILKEYQAQCQKQSTEIQNAESVQEQQDLKQVEQDVQNAENAPTEIELLQEILKELQKQKSQ